MNKLVSIIVPCYNGSNYLTPFFKSIIGQTYRPIELIFIDDGSTDDTRKCVQFYQNELEKKEIQFTYQYQDNRGQAAAINTGLQLIHGEYLMWMDSDDVLKPNNIEKKVLFLEAHPECGFVLCEGEITTPQLEKTGKYIYSRQEKDNGRLFKDLIYEKNVVFVPCGYLCNTSALISAIPTKRIFESRQGQNWQLLLPLAYNYKCGYIEESLFMYVEHGDSHSHQSRNYAEQMERYSGFEELLVETINRIETMSKGEKSYWIKEIHLKYCRMKMRCAYKHGDVKTARHEKKSLLQAGEKVSPFDCWIYYKLRGMAAYTYILLKRLSGEIKRGCKN